MALVALPVIYLDLTGHVDISDTSRPRVINRHPEPGEDDVPTTNAIELSVVDPGAAGLATVTKITVTSLIGGVPTVIVAFDQGGGGFHASYFTSTFLPSLSPGSGVIDEHKFQLIRFGLPFVSQEVVSVRVEAATADAALLDITYTFTVEDVTAPTLISARTRSLKKIIVTYSEPMRMDASFGGVLRVLEMSGRITFIKNDKAEVDHPGLRSNLAHDFV